MGFSYAPPMESFLWERLLSPCGHIFLVKSQKLHILHDSITALISTWPVFLDERTVELSQRGKISDFNTGMAFSCEGAGFYEEPALPVRLQIPDFVSRLRSFRKSLRGGRTSEVLVWFVFVFATCLSKSEVQNSLRTVRMRWNFLAGGLCFHKWTVVWVWLTIAVELWCSSHLNVTLILGHCTFFLPYVEVKFNVHFLFCLDSTN